VVELFDREQDAIADAAKSTEVFSAAMNPAFAA